MTQVNIHEAKTQLSMLIEKVAQGEPFIISKAGKPMAKVIPYIPTENKTSRVGFLSGQIKVPDDFNQMGQGKIVELFEGSAQ